MKSLGQVGYEAMLEIERLRDLCFDADARAWDAQTEQVKSAWEVVGAAIAKAEQERRQLVIDMHNEAAWRLAGVMTQGEE